MPMRYRDRQASTQRTSAAIELMMQVRAILNDDQDTVVSVSEHACGDPECCGSQTVVLVMRPDQPTKAVRLNKPMQRVTRADLANALASPCERAASPDSSSES